jgi:hypothetical protein
MAAEPRRLAGNGDRPATAGARGKMAGTMNRNAMNGTATGNGTAAENGTAVQYGTEMNQKAGGQR